MRRPTIPDLAEAAGVSVATVNRVLSGAANVRLATRERVQQAAEAIGFYGLGSIQARVAAARPRLRFGVLSAATAPPVLPEHRAARCRRRRHRRAGADVELRIEFLEDLSPQNTADPRAGRWPRTCDAICLTSAVHPVVTEAVEQHAGAGHSGLCPDLATVGHRADVLYRAGQLEGRPHLGLDLCQHLQERPARSAS